MTGRGRSRREFLRVASGATVAAAVAAAGIVGGRAGALAWRATGWRAKADATGALGRFLDDHAGARTIGAAARFTGVLGTRADEIIAGLAPRGVDPMRWLRTVSDRAFEHHVHTGARADFAAGRIVSVGGWYLAETEARVCAGFDALLAP
jgi:hypothetical protein